MSIPRRDPNFTMADLQEAADKFMEAGQEYWDACHKAGLDIGSVIYIDQSDKGMAIFTRGEYRHTIMQNIPQVGRTYQLGVTLSDDDT